MNRIEFEGIVRRAEALAGANPKSYRRRLAALTALGYLYIWFMLILLLAVLGGMLAFGYYALTHGRSGGAIQILLKGLIIVVPLCYVLAKSLWVRIEPPEGLRLRPEDAPELFREVERMREALQCSPVHEIVLDADFNAAMAQVPRFGIFGGYRNTLLLGLPLMRMASPGQLLSVIAHELGHLSHRHGTFGIWIYRVEATWGRLADQLNQGEASGAGLFRRFANWFMPRLAAWSFAERRQAEYEADRAAVEMTSARDAGGFLVLMDACARAYQRRSEKLMRQMFAAGPEPPADRVEKVVQMAGEVIETSDLTLPALRAFREPTGHTDSHPALRDRLRSMGFEVGPSMSAEDLERLGLVPAKPETTAIDHFLGPRAGALAARLSELLNRTVTEKWRAVHAEFGEYSARLAQLEEMHAAGTLAGDDRFARANLLGAVRGSDEGAAAWEELLAADPESLPANYHAGIRRLEEDDDSGIELLRKVMVSDPEARLEASQIIGSYLRRTGREELSEAYLREGDAAGEVVERLNTERSVVSASDAFLPAELTEAQLSPVRAVLRDSPHIKEAILVRRRLRAHPEESNHVLAFKLKALKQSQENSNRAVNALTEALGKGLEGTQCSWLVIDAADSSVWAAYRAMSKVPGAHIHKV